MPDGYNKTTTMKIPIINTDTAMTALKMLARKEGRDIPYGFSSSDNHWWIELQERDVNPFNDHYRIVVAGRPSTKPFDPLEQMFKSVAHEKAATERAAKSLTMQAKVRKYADLLTKAIRDEEEAYMLYQQIAALANELPEELAYDDIHFIKKIQSDENEHHETLTNILNDLKAKLRRST